MNAEVNGAVNIRPKITQSPSTGGMIDILSALKGDDSHDPVPLGWDGYGF